MLEPDSELLFRKWDTTSLESQYAVHESVSPGSVRVALSSNSINVSICSQNLDDRLEEEFRSSHFGNESARILGDFIYHRS